MVLRQLDSPRTKHTEWDPYLTPYANSNSKWIRRVETKAQTIKHLQENMEGDLCDLRCGSGFLDTTSNPRKSRHIGLTQTNDFVLHRTPARK